MQKLRERIIELRQIIFEGFTGVSKLEPLKIIDASILFFTGFISLFLKNSKSIYKTHFTHRLYYTGTFKKSNEKYKDGLVFCKVSTCIVIVPKDGAFIIGEIYGSEKYEAFYKINTNDIIFDVGAYVGLSSIKFANKTPGGLVVAFEPFPYNYQLLSCNIRNNNILNIIPVNIALGKSDGVVEFFVGNGSAGHSLRKEQATKNSIMIKMKTIDTIIKELNLPYVSFIKMDVEGAALDVLQGAESVLRQKPHIVVACEHGLTEVNEVCEFLLSKGFNVYLMPKFLYAD